MSALADSIAVSEVLAAGENISGKPRQSAVRHMLIARDLSDRRNELGCRLRPNGRLELYVTAEDVRLEESAATVSSATDLAEPVAEDGSPDVGAAEIPVADRQSEIGSLREAVERLGVQVAKEHIRAAARERTIDRLHDEVELLRAGQARILLRPAVSDLRRLHGDLIAQARSAPDGMTRAQVAALLESFADSAELALERCGVTVVRPAAGTPCDPRLHQAVGAKPTSSPDLDKTIVRVVSDGYAELDTGRTLAPARVVIYSLAPAEEGSSGS